MRTPRHGRPPAAPTVLLTLLDHPLLPLGWQLSIDQLAPFGCGDFSKQHMLHRFPIEPHLLPFCVCAHASLAYAMSFSSHELIHASGIELLPEVPGVLMSVEHLHYGRHGTHSGTRTVCPLILISDQRIAIALCPYYCGWIHPRKSTSGTAGKLIPMLLTNLTQYLECYYLGSLPRSSSFRFCLPFLLEGCLGTSWYGQPYFMPWLSLRVYFILVIEGRFVIPSIIQDSSK